MNRERPLRLIAGSFVLLAALLAWTISPWFLAFVGLSLTHALVAAR